LIVTNLTPSREEVVEKNGIRMAAMPLIKCEARFDASETQERAVGRHLGGSAEPFNRMAAPILLSHSVS
jgi:hypothetical protein